MTLLKNASSGTYIEEVNLSQVASPSASDIGAIVGEFSRGPINTPKLHLTTDQFIEDRGEPDPENLLWPTTYAGYYFLRRASQLYSVRVINNTTNDHSFGGLKVSTDNATTPTTNTAAAIGSAVTDPETGVTFGGSTELFYAYAKGPGTYGNNYSIELRSNNAISPASGDLTVTEGGVGTGTLADATTYSYRVAVVTSGGIMAAGTADSVLTTAGTNSATITWPFVSNAIAYRVYGRVGGSEELIAEVSQPSGTPSTVSYTDDGTVTPDGAVPTTSQYESTFFVDIYDSDVSATVPVESYEVSLDFQTDGFNQQLEIESKINNFSKRISVLKNPSYGTTTIFPMAKDTFEDGADGTSPTVSDISTGWDLFADKEKITVRHLIAGGAASPTVAQKMEYVANRRGDCTHYNDVPTISQGAQDAVVYRKQTLNLNTTRGALYTPDLLIQDDFNGRQIYIPPSGHAAGIGALSGLRAPAGLNRGVLSDVQGLRYEYNQEQRDLLAANKINYARNMQGRGIAFMEAFTLEAQMSALSFLNVRYTLNAIAPAVENSLDFSLFEPNDDILRRQVVNIISEFLDVIRDDRAIQEYLVVCDDSNNSAIITGNGQLNVDIRIIPTLPVQRIRVRLIVTKQGVSLAEVEAG